MTLTQRMDRAAELSKVREWEWEWDHAEAAMRAGTLDRAAFDVVHESLRAARDRYFVIYRALRDADNA